LGESDVLSGGRVSVLLLGGGRYNVLSINAVRRAGFRTLVADRDRAAPGLAAADIGIVVDPADGAALLRAIHELGGVDGVVPLSEVGVRSAAWLSSELGLPSSTQSAASYATSKAGMRERWAGLGSHSVPAHVASSVDEAYDAVARVGGFPVIVKPDRSYGGSRGVTRVDGVEEVPAAFAFATSLGLPGTAVVVEPYLVGSEHSCEVLLHRGRASVLCVGQKVKTAFPYRVDVSVRYPALVGDAETALVREMCQQAVDALGLVSGVVHIEFVLTDGGPVLIELGARCGGGHTPAIARHVSGVDEIVETCRLACGLDPTSAQPAEGGGADYRFLMFDPGRVAAVAVPREVVDEPRIADVAVTIGRGDVVRTVRTTGDRQGFVVALGDDRNEAVKIADWACERITVTYDDGRVARPYPPNCLGAT
jgi:biotin carboxylase